MIFIKYAWEIALQNKKGFFFLYKCYTKILFNFKNRAGLKNGKISLFHIFY